MSIYGYARVSTAEQREDRQIFALQKNGVCAENIFLDRRSGKDFNRPGWKRLLKRLERGDQLVVLSLDRLGRNYHETIDQWREIVKKKVRIRVLDMPMLDTAHTAYGEIGCLITDLVLHLLSYFADSERRNIHERQRQGIAAAKARGVRFGRRRTPIPDNFSRLVADVHQKRLTTVQAARLAGISRSTFRRRELELITQS